MVHIQTRYEASCTVSIHEQKAFIISRMNARSDLKFAQNALALVQLRITVSSEFIFPLVQDRRVKDEKKKKKKPNENENTMKKIMH